MFENTKIKKILKNFDKESLKYNEYDAETYEILFDAGKIQFSDIPKDKVSEYIALKSLMVGEATFKDIPKEKQTDAVCSEAITHGDSFKSVPDRFQNKFVCQSALVDAEIDSEDIPNLVDNVFKSIREDLMDYDMALFGVKTGVLLKNVKEQFKNKQLCMTAVKKKGINIKYVPPQIIDKDMCLEAVMNGALLNSFQKKYQDKEIAEKSVKQTIQNLEYVREDLRTQELFENSIRQEKNALRFMKEYEQTYDLCLLAVQTHGLQEINNIKGEENLDIISKIVRVIAPGKDEISDVESSIVNPDVKEILKEYVNEKEHVADSVDALTHSGSKRFEKGIDRNEREKDDDMMRVIE